MIQVDEINQSINELLRRSHAYLAIEPLVEVLQPTTLYVDSLEEPCLFALMDQEAMILYLGGHTEDEVKYRRYLKQVKDLFISNNKPIAYLQVASSNPLASHWLSKHYSAFIIHRGERVLYTYRGGPLSIKSDTSHLEVISRDLLRRKLNNQDGLVNEITSLWGSVESFLDRGFGICALKDQTLLGWAASETVSKTACGMVMATGSTYRNHDLGIIMGQAFVNESLDKKIQPFINLWADDEEGRELAHCLGFERLAAYQVLVLKSNY